MEIKELAQKMAVTLESKKAEDVVVLDLREISSLADFFVIATGTNAKHATSLADYVEEAVEVEGFELHHSEGLRNGDWVILDYMDIMVHIFNGEKRGLYGLDELWKDGLKVEF